MKSDRRSERCFVHDIFIFKDAHEPAEASSDCLVSLGQSVLGGTRISNEHIEMEHIEAKHVVIKHDEMEHDSRV